MALNANNLFNPSGSNNLRKVESGVILNEVPGLGKVETYGGPLRWRHVSVPKDNSIITEKRDRFDRRNALVNGIAEAGEFEYALAVAPSVNGKRIAQCSFCSAHHNWVVFYRDASGKYLGWSGTVCFGEIVRNLNLPAAEAMAKAVNAERNRCENFRRTMEKINDFKRGFPSVYEHREALARPGQNPYAKLWWAVRNRLNSMNGVDEKWLQSCKDGAYDRESRVYDHQNGGFRVIRNEDARRIPDFLVYLSDKLNGGVPIEEVLKGLREKHAQEEAEAQAAARAAMAKPTPAPVAPPAPAPAPKTDADGIDWDAVQTKARALKAAGAHNWSFAVNECAKGTKVKPGLARWVLAQPDPASKV